MWFVPFLSIFSDIGDFFSGLPDMLLNGIVNGLKYVFGLLLYLISIAICKLVDIMYGFFAIFSGMEKIQYADEDKYLINVFFENPTISKAYWGFACLSFVLIFAFLIVAVIRKLFDANGKQKESYGELITSSGKAVLIIVLMSAIMSVSLNITNVLMQRVAAIFDYASTGKQEPYRAFSDEEFAVMNHALEVIGNYSMNPSYTNRYNINSCFNDIRDDLLYLQEAGVFDYNYYRYYVDSEGKEVEIPNWQRSLQKISKTANLKRELKSDIYNDKVTSAIVETVTIINDYPDFAPLQYIRSSYDTTSIDSLDVIIFMTGTANAAQNPAYNENASITDPVRGPYFAGEQSIYSYDDVTDDFDIKLGGIDYPIIIILAALMVWQLFGCIMSCAVRIFNLMLIYIIAPPFAATIPLDGGHRFKSWTEAFVVQLLNVFGTVICMRILILYIPIILGDELVLFDNGFLNLVGKAILIYAGVVACSRGADLFSGILTGNGASASASAGNMTAMSNGLFSSAAKSVGKKALGAAAFVTGFDALDNKLGITDSGKANKRARQEAQEKENDRNLQKELALDTQRAIYSSADKLSAAIKGSSPESSASSSADTSGNPADSSDASVNPLMQRRIANDSNPQPEVKPTKTIPSVNNSSGGGSPRRIKAEDTNLFGPPKSSGSVPQPAKKIKAEDTNLFGPSKSSQTDTPKKQIKVSDTNLFGPPDKK